MNTFAKILVLGFAVAVTAPLAFASPIVSGFDVSGMDNDAFANYPSVGSVTFGTNQETASSNGSGLFSGTSAGTPLTFVSNFAFYGIPAAGSELMSFSQGADNFVFYVTSVSESNATVTFDGYLLETGATDASFLAYMTMENNDDQLNQNLLLSPFSGFFALLPEPNSLVLMGTGLMAMAMLFRKRLLAGR